MAVRNVLSLLALLGLVACAGQQGQSKCEDLPPAEKEECMAELYKAMEEYKKQRRDQSVENPRY